MSTENNTGLSWSSENDRYFLRDDEALGLCDYERYSLFREFPGYGRVVVLTGKLAWAIMRAGIAVRNDRYARGHNEETALLIEGEL
jgi:hypothetical protein